MMSRVPECCIATLTNRGYFWKSEWPGEIREMRWQLNHGWELQSLQNKDFKDFGWGGIVAAVTWLDQFGQDQIRSYCLHNKLKKLHLLEFESGPNGWTRQTKLPDWSVDSVLPQLQGAKILDLRYQPCQLSFGHPLT